MSEFDEFISEFCTPALQEQFGETDGIQISTNGKESVAVDAIIGRVRTEEIDSEYGEMMRTKKVEQVTVRISISTALDFNLNSLVRVREDERDWTIQSHAEDAGFISIELQRDFIMKSQHSGLER